MRVGFVGESGVHELEVAGLPGGRCTIEARSLRTAEEGAGLDLFEARVVVGWQDGPSRRARVALSTVAPPPPNRKPVWIAIGVVAGVLAAGGAVLAVILTRPGPDWVVDSYGALAP